MNEIDKIISHSKISEFISRTTLFKMRYKYFISDKLDEATREEDKNASITRDVSSHLVFKSLYQSFLLILTITLFLNFLYHTELTSVSDWQLDKLFTGSIAIFVAFFVYNYTLFNNKWKYTADLYNKIYIDQSFNNDPVALFRRRCLLAHDILIQKMQYHSSFECEFNQTVILAAYFCSENNLISNCEIIENHHDYYFKFFSSPEEVLTKSIISCENAELQHYLSKNSIEKNDSSNSSTFLLQLIINKIEENDFSTKESNKFLKDTISTINNSNNADALVKAKNFIESYKKAS